MACLNDDAGRVSHIFQQALELWITLPAKCITTR